MQMNLFQRMLFKYVAKVHIKTKKRITEIIELIIILIQMKEFSRMFPLSMRVCKSSPLCEVCGVITMDARLQRTCG